MEDQPTRQPTEEERLAWKDRQQKRDKLSDSMGQYLLKGYRMLSANCEDCGVSLPTVPGLYEWGLYYLDHLQLFQS